MQKICKQKIIKTHFLYKIHGGQAWYKPDSFQCSYGFPNHGIFLVDFLGKYTHATPNGFTRIYISMASPGPRVSRIAHDVPKNGQSVCQVTFKNGPRFDGWGWFFVIIPSLTFHSGMLEVTFM